MKPKKITGIFFLLLFILLAAGCAQQKYTLVLAPEKTAADSSQVTINGEKIGWEDIQRMPR